MLPASSLPAIGQTLAPELIQAQLEAGSGGGASDFEFSLETDHARNNSHRFSGINPVNVNFIKSVLELLANGAPPADPLTPPPTAPIAPPDLPVAPPVVLEECSARGGRF